MDEPPADAPAAVSGPARGAGAFAWRLGLALLFIGLVAAYVDVSRVMAHLTPDTAWAVALMQPVIAVGYLVAAARLSVLAGGAGYRHALRAVILCYGMNVVLPARLSELVKIAYLREHARLPGSECLAAVVLERMLDVMMLGALALAAAALFLAPVSGLAVAALALGAVGLALLPRLAGPLVRLARLAPGAALAAFLERFVVTAAERARTRAVWIAFGFSIVIWILAAAGTLVFLRAALGDSIGVKEALLVYAAVVVGISIPGLPGNLGTYEAGAVLALRHVGLGLEQALAVALAMHIGHVVLALALSVGLLALDRTGVRSLLASARHALKRK
jgi:uncharacterized membrane protein YbhN (UPF0104 family)